MITLGIETTCDETAASIVQDGKKILSNVVTSQIDLHAIYGGVFPELAARRHLELILPVIEKALSKANLESTDIDLVAAAYGPGLIGAILVGLNAAKALSFAWDCPFVGVNHVAAHLYAAMMDQEEAIFPSLGLVLSGGHTFLVKMESFGVYERIGGTVDDAIGEAFDKVATLLDLPYPGGPEIEKLAERGDPTRFVFKSGVVKGRPWDFSFSGLKTNLLYAIKGQNGDRKSASLIKEEEKADLAAAFQEAAFRAVVSKTVDATREFGAKAIYCGGGVTNNQYLRRLFNQKIQEVPLFWPERGLSLDNAAMIAGLGFQLYRKSGQGDSYTLEPKTRIPI